MMRWLAAGVLFVILLFGAAFILHPYLSITEPSGADVAVVEGWLPPDLLPQVKKVIIEKGYTKVYTTGTTRPFAYWLKRNDRIEIELSQPAEGGVSLVAAGLPGARLVVLADADTMMQREVTGDTATYWVQLQRPVSQISMMPSVTNGPDDVDVIFLKKLEIQGIGAHASPHSITIHRADGSIENGRPTYAHAFAFELQRSGLVGVEIIPVPAEISDRGRTWSNANAFAIKAKEDGLESVDVISMGVHARRSRNVYQEALSTNVRTGIISIPDPQAPPGEWWHTSIGWIRLLKEVVGIPVSELNGD
jgi:hypothetical protein